MTRKRWKLLSGIALAFGIQEVFAGETWLVITSDPPGAAVSVDNAYRGTTPERPRDTLRITVPEGMRVIEVHKWVNEKEYAARKTVEVIGENENFVQFNLRKKTVSTSVIPAASPAQDGQTWFGTVIPLGELEVPGRNF